uniref:Uncharacterized protein n=1 Tax=Arundo donax TaxID=35708 RepID=A0A0A9GE87_ARUDO
MPCFLFKVNIIVFKKSCMNSTAQIMVCHPMFARTKEYRTIAAAEELHTTYSVKKLTKGYSTAMRANKSRQISTMMILEGYPLSSRS